VGTLSCHAGLLAWHDFSGDAAALTAARRAADLICRTYLDGTRRVHDAGSHEMNMAVSHVMAELHRRTGEPRYSETCQEIEKDWERAGDYARTGAAGVPFYKTPLPRWESLTTFRRSSSSGPHRRRPLSRRLHQPLAQHPRIRCPELRRVQRREQATGNAFAPTAIETAAPWRGWPEHRHAAACTAILTSPTSWSALRSMARSARRIRRAAGGPTTRRWTATARQRHDIVFQARAGTPELNCCSVNGPRVTGMLADWAVMKDKDGGLVINWHGPMEVTVKDHRSAGHTQVRVRMAIDGRVLWRSTAGRNFASLPHSLVGGGNDRIDRRGCPARNPDLAGYRTHLARDDAITLNFPLTLRAIPAVVSRRGK
jgi:hypothetical protein